MRFFLLLSLSIFISRAANAFEHSNFHEQNAIFTNERKSFMISEGIPYRLTPISWQELDEIQREIGAVFNEKYELAYASRNLFLGREMNEMRILNEEEHKEVDAKTFWIYLSISIGLTVFAGLMSGLTVGYLSIDDLVLELKLKNGTEEEKKHANIVLPILHKHHQLLVTLLIANAACMEALPVFLDAIVATYIAIIISVSAVLFFGEIIPQAICTGPKQIQIAASIAPLTKTLMFVLSPIAWPMAKLLDKILGHQGKSRFLNSDLKALIELHSAHALEGIGQFNTTEGHIGLQREQTKLIAGAIDMHNDTVLRVMKPWDSVYKLSDEKVITRKTLRKIGKMGFSRVPVYSGKDKDKVLGVLLLKKFVGFDLFESRGTLRSLQIDLRKPLVVPPSLTLGAMLKEFQKGASHMALVTNNVTSVKEYMSNPMSETDINVIRTKPVILGMVTMEDVIECLLQSNIDDEGDFDEKRMTNPASRMFSFKQHQHSDPRLKKFNSNLSENPHKSDREMMDYMAFEDRKKVLVNSVLNDSKRLAEIVEKSEIEKKNAGKHGQSDIELQQRFLPLDSIGSLTSMKRNPTEEESGFKDYYQGKNPGEKPFEESKE